MFNTSNSVGLNLGGLVSLCNGTFYTPQYLFQQNEQGAWYDPSDLSTLYQDAAGTTPVTAVEQPVGKILDKSGRGNHATASGTARPTLSAKYNVLQYTQDFSNSYWIKRGTCTVTANSTTAPDGTLTASKIDGIDTGTNDFYNSDYATVTIAPSGTSLTPSIYIKRISTSGTLIITNATDQAQGQWTVNMAFLPDDWVRITSTTTGVTVTNAFIANNTTFPGKCGLLIRASSGGPISAYFWGADLRVTNDGVNLPNYQRVNASTDYATTGFPLYLLFSGAQGMSTPASIPFATVTSDGQARRNILTYPAQIGNTGGWAVNAVTATVNNITAPDGTNTGTAVSAASAANGFVITVAQSPTATTTYTFSVYAKGVTGGEIIKLYADGGFNGSVGPAITLTTTWTRYTYTVTASTSTIGYCYLLSGTAYGGTGQAFYCWGAQLEVGSTATAFQNIGTDQMTVWTGERKLSDATIGNIAETGNGSNLQTFSMNAPRSAATANYGFTSRGSISVDAISGNSYTSPITNVLTGISSISGDQCILRANGTQVSSNAADQGTGIYDTYPLWIGIRSNGTIPLTGRIYSLIVRGAASSATQISSTEGWVNIKTAAY